MGAKAGSAAGVSAIDDRLTAVESAMSGLAEAVASSGLSAPELDAVVGRLRRMERMTAGVVSACVSLARRFEAAGGRHVEDVLGAGADVSKVEAREQRQRSEVLEAFPTLSQQLIAGDARPVNVDVLARLTGQMTPEEVSLLAEADEKLAEKASTLGEESFRKTVSRMRDRIRRDGGEAAAERATKDQFVRVSPTPDRSGYRLAGLLDGENGGFVQAAIHREYRRLNSSDAEAAGLTGDQAMAQALTNLVVRGDQVDPSLASRPSVSLSVLCDRDTLATGPHAATVSETVDGVTIAPSRLGCFGCDGVLRRVDTLPDGSVHVSHTGRTATEAQRAALRALYPSCPLDGSPWSQIEVHHTVHYEYSRRTVLSELVPISKAWHHRVHDQGWRIELDANRTLRLYRPDGTLDRTIPPPKPVDQAARANALELEGIGLDAAA